MDVMNDLYKEQCLVLPNEYVFLTGELRASNHSRCALHGMSCNAAKGGNDSDCTLNWRRGSMLPANYLESNLQPNHVKTQPGCS